MARYSDADWKPSPNFRVGRAGHVVKAVCLHITEGPAGNEYQSAINWFRNPSSAVSAHFVISESGSITQTVDTDSTAYAQGLSHYLRASELPKGWTWQGAGWYSAHAKRVTPAWQLITEGVNPNFEIVSIEHAGQHYAPRTAAQMGASVALLRWLSGIYPQLRPFVPGRTLLGHFMLDNMDRPNCPGPYFDLAAIAAQANSAASAPPTAKSFVFPGLAVYKSSMLTGEIALHLPESAVLEIDQIGGAGYAQFAGHVKHASWVDVMGPRMADGPGFVDVRLLK